MNFYKRHLGDYAKDTGHLSPLEHGVFTLLLDWYYASEQPIPADKVYRVAKATTKTERQATDNVLADFFTREGDVWTNKRADVEIAAAHAQAETNRRIAEEREAKRKASRTVHEPCNETPNEKATKERGRSGEPSQTPDSRLQTPEDQNQERPAGAGLSPLAGATGDQPPPATVIEHPQIDRVPYERIVDLYHEILPMLPRVAALTDKRKSHIRARWKSGELPDLDTWRAYFSDVSRSDFLCGRAQPAPGRRVFFADIDWLTNQANLVKFQEGKYDNSGDRRHG